MGSAEQIQAAAAAAGTPAQPLGAAFAHIRALVVPDQGLLQALDHIEAATQPASDSQIPLQPTSHHIFGWTWSVQELAEMQEAIQAASSVSLPNEQNEKITRAAERLVQESAERARKQPAAADSA